MKWTSAAPSSRITFRPWLMAPGPAGPTASVTSKHCSLQSALRRDERPERPGKRSGSSQGWFRPLGAPDLQRRLAIGCGTRPLTRRAHPVSVSVQIVAGRDDFAERGLCEQLCSALKMPAAFCLSLPARNERGESRREGKLIKD